MKRTIFYLTMVLLVLAIPGLINLNLFKDQLRPYLDQASIADFRDGHLHLIPRPAIKLSQVTLKGNPDWLITEANLSASWWDLPGDELSLVFAAKGQQIKTASLNDEAALDFVATARVNRHTQVLQSLTGALTPDIRQAGIYVGGKIPFSLISQGQARDRQEFDLEIQLANLEVNVRKALLKLSGRATEIKAKGSYTKTGIELTSFLWEDPAFSVNASGKFDQVSKKGEASLAFILQGGEAARELFPGQEIRGQSLYAQWRSDGKQHKTYGDWQSDVKGLECKLNWAVAVDAGKPSGQVHGDCPAIDYDQAIFPFLSSLTYASQRPIYLASAFKERQPITVPAWPQQPMLADDSFKLELLLHNLTINGGTFNELKITAQAANEDITADMAAKAASGGQLRIAMSVPKWQDPEPKACLEADITTLSTDLINTLTRETAKLPPHFGLSLKGRGCGYDWRRHQWQQDAGWQANLAMLPLTPL